MLAKLSWPAAAVVGILIFGVGLTSTFQDDSPSESEIRERALLEKEAVISHIADGGILYIRDQSYRKPDPSLKPGAWVYPERTNGETWMPADSSGNTSTLTGVSRTLQGELLAVSHLDLEEGRRIATWVSTGEQIVVEIGIISSLTGWVEGIWDSSQIYMDRGWNYVGQGMLDGERSIILEQQYPSPTSQNMVNRLEFMRVAPLIWRSSRWEMNEEGTRALVVEHRTLEYQLLPADTPPIGLFE